MSKGIQLTTDGSPINSNGTEYNSTNLRIQVALNKTPPHLQIFDVNYNVLTTDVSHVLASETLAVIKHGLSYKPMVLIYFYRYDTDSYSIGKLFFGYGAIDDYLYYVVDSTNITIYHDVDTFGIGTSYTSGSGKIRIKLWILSVPVNKLISDVNA